MKWHSKAIRFAPYRPRMRVPCADYGRRYAQGTLSELQSSVNNDPLVAENVVSAEILEVVPAKANERVQFLLG